MSNVLKVTKTDGTNHIMPVENEAFWKSYNNKLPVEKRVKLERISAAEAKDVPYKDPNYVSPAKAAVMVTELQQDNVFKDSVIEELRNQLEALKGKTSSSEPQSASAQLPEAADGKFQAEFNGGVQLPINHPQHPANMTIAPEPTPEELTKTKAKKVS